VEGRVLNRMPQQTAAETRRAVADAVVRVDPAAAAARRDRRIERLTQPDGMRSWWFPMPADVERDMWAAATTRAIAVKAARAAAGLDEMGLDALRVDVVPAAVLGLAGPATTEVTRHPHGLFRSARTAASRSLRSWSTCPRPCAWRTTPG
jgi:hypothetical protein